MRIQSIPARMAVVSALCLAILFACSKKPTEVPETHTIPAPPPYKIAPPQGKLPWPQHDPEFDATAYEKMLLNLFIINNFGQYQGGETTESLYFHDGLDIVLPNGTKIFAVDSGTVRAINGSPPYYMSLIIEDENQPGYAWDYTHVYNFQVQVGDFVHQGTHIAEVSFEGVDHIHLNRIYLAPGGSWKDYQDAYHIQPDRFFEYKDPTPPIIETPFTYFPNNATTMFEPGTPTAVSGEVDIVVGMREVGPYSRSKGIVLFPGYGDRLCVTRIEYSISGQGIASVRKKSFDFSQIILKWRPGYGLRDYDRVSAVYMFYKNIHPGKITSWNKIFSYYVITNTDGSGKFGEIRPEDRAYSWNTLARHADGTPVFPNGDYVITVRAYDFKGNMAEAQDTVRVQN